MSARRLVVGLCVVAGVLLGVSASAFASPPETPGPVTVRWSAETQSLVFHGVLNPNAAGEAGTYEFLYKASKTECQGASTERGLALGLMEENVAQPVSGLSSGTEYSVCLLARTLGGETSVGPVMTFKTTEPPITETATSITARTAVLHGLSNPSSAGEAGSYRFLYTRSANTCESKENQQATSTESDAGLKQESVSSEVTGLLPNATYTSCLVALNGAEETAVGGPVTFTTPATPPTITEASATNVGSLDVTLTARIDPGGASTNYRVEYGASLPYQSSTPEQGVYSNEPVTVQVEIPGLQAGALYHYRIVASNSLGTAETADATISTFETASLTLPDRRRYEKVTPNNNADGNVYLPEWKAATEGGWTEQPFVVAADGDALAYMADPSESGGNGHEGGGDGNQYIATRAPNGGWAAVNVTPASGGFAVAPAYSGFSKDLTAGYLTSNGAPLASGAPGKEFPTPYVRDFGSGSYEALLTTTPPNREPYAFGGYGLPKNSDFGENEPIYAGSSADFKHIIYFANDALTPNAVDGGPEENNLYDAYDGTLTLVDVLPNGTTEPNATFGGPHHPYRSNEGDGPALTNDISEDGSRIFWTDLNNNNLYVRENGSSTVQVDAGVGGGGKFWAASPDGATVLFVKAGDLYEYDLETAQTTDLTPGGEVQGIVGTSMDLSYVYFVADAALAPGAEHVECHGESLCNLYALHVGEPARLVAQLAYKDNESSQSFEALVYGDWQSGAGDKEAEATPDGKHLVFTSARPITGDQSSGRKVYEYDYEGAQLHCASCSPTGVPTPGGSILQVSHMNTYLPRWMASDGSKVFFDSTQPLVPQDTNGKMDVYEWEQGGSGDCVRGTGCIYLLSSGTSPEPSELIEASESGDDVFFVTRAQLIEEDGNQNWDVYDARADAPLPPTPSQCTGSGCQGVPLAPPVFATPSSVTFKGVGNFAASSKAVGKRTKPKSKKKTKKHSKTAMHVKKVRRAGTSNSKHRRSK